MCSTWDARCGANACFVVDPEELGDGPAELPDDGPLVENEVVVAQWIERDDGLPTSLTPAFFSADGLNSVGDDIRKKVSWGTRLGGVPRWIQTPEQGPGSGWQFVGQLDSTHSFLTPPKVEETWIWEDRERWESRTHAGQGPNFGDGGIAYLFLRHLDAAPQGCVFWQCG